jgi:hypothetical protein
MKRQGEKHASKHTNREQRQWVCGTGRRRSSIMFLYVGCIEIAPASPCTSWGAGVEKSIRSPLTCNTLLLDGTSNVMSRVVQS